MPLSSLMLLDGINTWMKSKLKLLKRDCNQWSLFTMAIGLFIATPIFTIGIYLLVGRGEMWSHIVQHYLFEYISNSLFLLLGTGLLSLFFGVTTAWLISNYQFRYRRLFKWMLFLPLSIPSYIVAYTYVGLFDNGGTVIRGLQSIGITIQKIDMMNRFGLIWVLSCSLFPYVYASCMAMFSSIPRNVREASELLGAKKWRYFFTIALPLASPAIIGGLFLVFMEVLNDYGAAKYFGVKTFTTGIFRSWTMLEDLQSAVYLSALLVSIVFIINAFVKWLRGKKSYAVKSNTTAQLLQRKPMAKRKKIIYYALLVTPIVFGFILPVFQLLYWAVLTFDHMFNWELIQIALQSIALAALATLFILLAALALIYFTRWNHLKSLGIFKKLSTIGYVIPGAIIGIGVIRSSQAIINFFDQTFGLQIGFLFYGSMVVLVYAYVFRFLAVAFNLLEANSLQIGKKLAEASYILRIGKFKTLAKIELPLMSTAVISASLLVLIEILKELPLTLILKPYNVRTLAAKAYEYAEDERVAEAALPALFLILLIIFLMATVNYLDKRKTKLSPIDDQKKNHL